MEIRLSKFHCKKYLPVHSKVVCVFLLRKLGEYWIPPFSSWRSTHIRILRTLRIPVMVN